MLLHDAVATIAEARRAADFLSITSGQKVLVLNLMSLLV